MVRSRQAYLWAACSESDAQRQIAHQQLHKLAVHAALRHKAQVRVHVLRHVEPGVVDGVHELQQLLSGSVSRELGVEQLAQMVGNRAALTAWLVQDGGGQVGRRRVALNILCARE